MDEQLLIDYINDPENADKNYKLGRAYENLGQTASAFSFYLRAAERTPHKDLEYECLIRLGNCFKDQSNRKASVKGMYQAAITLYPERPEAYYYLSKILEEEKSHFEAYMLLEVAMNISKGKAFPKLAVYYPGTWILLFQKAVSSWWRGKGTESRALFQYLFDNHWNDMDQMHKDSVWHNIVSLGSGFPAHNHRMYDWRRQFSKLRYKFIRSPNIRQNYAQIYQDLFVLAMLNGKENGTFLEIGGAGPEKGNNTKLLESQFGWTGTSIEFDLTFAQEYRAARPKTNVLIEDALKVDYDKLIAEEFKGEIIDYLQLDIEPAGNTYECMLRIPFDKYKFRVITYEHDYYADFTRSFREKSRKFLESKGYVMVANDLSPDGVSTFEDWWVHPDLVDPAILEVMMDNTPGAKNATDYMFPPKPILTDENFDWGYVEYNRWFRAGLEREMFVEKVYQRFVPVKEGDTILDIGACNGTFPHSVRNQKPGRMICLEPHKKLFKTLQKNLPDATCINKAIGYTDGLENQNGLFNEKLIEADLYGGGLEDSISFKTLINDYKIDHINFLKMDCEGGEYAVFTDDNIDWIHKNVDYIAGEFHLNSPELKEKFRNFRDKHLKTFSNYTVMSVDYVDITHFLFDDWFIPRYECINIYIDNRAKQLTPLKLDDIVERKKVHTIIDTTAPKEKKYIKDKWKYSISPTLEFTTSIPEKGCVVDCVFCPQKTLLQKYTGERRLSFENFKMVVDKLPKEIRVTFSGFTEPFLNSDCTNMILYAHELGHPVSVFTTLVGVKVDDLRRIMHIPWAGNPNGGFTVHLPDQERRAKHPINANYIATASWFAQNMGAFKNATLMSMGTVHQDVADYYRGMTVHQNDMWDRAGNLKGEALLKEDLNREKFRSVAPPEPGAQYTCGCDERLYHNIVLPNGDVSLCCMDYGLEEITGNIFTSDYNDVIPDPYEVFKMCARCENRVDVNSRFIKAERSYKGV
jgi:FkbM family methyltransferase